MKKLLVLLLVLSFGFSSLAFAESTETVILHGVLEKKPEAIASPLAYLCAVRALKVLDAFFMGDLSVLDAYTELQMVADLCPYDDGEEGVNSHLSIIAGHFKTEQSKYSYRYDMELDEWDLEEILECYDALYMAVHGL